MTALVVKRSEQNLCVTDLDINTAEVLHRNEFSVGSKLRFDFITLVDNVNVVVFFDNADALKLFVDIFPVKDRICNLAEEVARLLGCVLVNHDDGNFVVAVGLNRAGCGLNL